MSEDLTGALDWPPPPQEKECIAVATLNLLRLQVSSSIGVFPGDGVAHARHLLLV